MANGYATRRYRGVITGIPATEPFNGNRALILV
jgi:hypothetical protein